MGSNFYSWFGCLLLALPLVSSIPTSTPQPCDSPELLNAKDGAEVLMKFGEAQLRATGLDILTCSDVDQGILNAINILQSYLSLTKGLLNSSIESNTTKLTLLSTILDRVLVDACEWSDDLKKCKLPCISSLRAMFHTQCLAWLKAVTGIDLTDTIDMTCSKYEYTDMLLCHDDELEGRRIAFIYYLVPEWTDEDGGSLDLFNVDEHGEPKDVVKSLTPVWNNFIFFDVNALSFHQVSEVLSASKTRLSVNGWFHGPPATRPPPYKEPVPLMLSPTPSGLETLSEWVNPLYLDVGVQTRIQQQFEMDSQIELPDFLLEEKYKLLCEEMENCSQLKWMVKGPPSRRHVHVAETASIPLITVACLKFVHSEPFCRLLAHLTGLDLAEDVIRPDLKQLEMIKGEEFSATSSEDAVDSKRDHKKVPDAESKDSQTEICDKTLKSEALKGHARPVASCCGDLYFWQPGDYTLAMAGDSSDPEMGKYALDALLYFCCEGWSPDFGGTTSYIAKDEDEELLSVTPTSNALSLVYRDQEALRFTKYINHRAIDHRDSSFFTMEMVYKENEEDSPSSQPPAKHTS